MNFNEMDNVELRQYDYSKLNQEQKEDLLSALKTELQIVNKETELVELDGQIQTLQVELIFATSKLESLKKDTERF